MSLVEIARLFDFVREASPNRGLRVEAIQHWSGGQPADSWCCEFATMVLDLHFKGHAPISRGGSCQDVYEQALQEHWIVDEPQPDDLYLYINDAGRAHHIGFVVTGAPLSGISGNTSPDGASSNGDGVHEHYLIVKPEHIRFVRVPGV
jgi:hypothetical protein